MGTNFVSYATTEWLRDRLLWLEAHHKYLRDQARLGGSSPCDPKDEPPAPGSSEQWLIHCRIVYLEALIDCLKKPVNEQAACCDEAYTLYLYCCTHPPGGGGG